MLLLRDLVLFHNNNLSLFNLIFRSEFEERQLNVTEQLTEELTNRGLTERDRVSDSKYYRTIN